MSKFFLYSNKNCQKKEVPKKQWYSGFVLNYFGLNIITISMIGVLFVTYIVLCSTATSNSLKLRSLEQQFSKCKEESRGLEYTIQSLRSMDHIKLLSENFSLEPINNPKYIQGQSVVAYNE